MHRATRRIIVKTAVILVTVCRLTEGAALDYVWQKEQVGGISAEANDLIQKLEAHIDEMINAGHLQPAYYRVGLSGEFLLYGFPGETAYILSDALPLVSPAMQSGIRAYLTEYMTLYPPMTRAFIHGNGHWGNIVLADHTPRREYYPMPPATTANIWPPPTVPFESLYMLWRYADATGDWDYVQSRLGALQSLYETYGEARRYGHIAGLVGMARIAEKLGQPSLRDDAVAKAVAAIDASDYASWLAGAQSEMTRVSHDWSYPLFHYARLESPIGALFCPEIGRLVRETQLSEARSTLELIVGPVFEGHAQASYPGWFVFRADHCYEEFITKVTPWMTRGDSHIQEQGGENAYNAPDFAWTLFHLRAAVLGDGAQSLRAMIDQPTCMGDLYYIQKLATAIRAHGARTWQDVRGAAAPAAPQGLRVGK